MTVSTTTARSGPYAGSGTTGPFTVGFRFLENSHIKVVKNVAGVEEELELDVDYTVTGAGASSGSVTLGTALATGQTLTIVRNVPTTQETDYVAGDSFPAESHERALDQLTMIAQQLKEEVDRSAKLPVSNTEDANALVADIVRLADSADELDAVAAIVADVTTVAGVDTEVTTVAGIAANVTTVAGIAANVTSVAGNATNINTVAGVSSNVTTVAGVAANVTTVAGISAAVSTVAADGTDIGAVAAISVDVQAVADIASDVSAVENIAANVTTVAGISSNVTTVAGIAANVTTVAGVSAAVSTVATNIASVNSAATNMAAIIAAPTEAANAASSASSAAASAAAAASSLDSFDDRYLGPKSSDPTLDNDGNALVTGALYYNTTTQTMKVYDGANWITATAAGTTAMNVYKYVATAGQTTFSGAAAVGGTMSYTSGNIIVFLNGAALDSTDYTATNGTSVVLASGAALNDEVVVVAFKSFTVADTYTQSAADALLATKVSLTGNQTVAGVKTFSSAPVLPAGAIPQAALATNVAGNGPAFSIFASTTTSLPSSTFTKVSLNGSEFDTTGGMISSSRFTPTVAGYYYITGSAYFGTSAESFVQIFKNGSSDKRGTDHGAQVWSRMVNALVYLNGSTDYVELYAYQASGSTLTVSASNAQTFFQGFLARAA